ncbi:MAG: SDR family oxidoreductase [Deltaproteobacteria bacterium]|nr:SDR family oxidoreductase [Deltaproteobacteria bacterium]
MTSFLVTGAAGFIGSNLVEALVSAGEQVIGLDNLLTGKRENLEGLAGDFRFVEGDVRDLKRLRELCRGVDFVLHQAALASVPWSVEEPILAHEHNTTGTHNVLVAARDAGVRRVVLASSSAIYGETDVVPSPESLPPRPTSPYAATKVAAEALAAAFCASMGLETVALRYFNVYGPRQDPASGYAAAIPAFVAKALVGERPMIFGDGEQTRDFVYVEDVVRANLLACEAEPQACGRAFNVGTGVAVTVNELCATILEVAGAAVVPDRGPERAGDVRHSRADIAAARKALGFEPRFDLPGGLARAIDWYRESLR